MSPAVTPQPEELAIYPGRPKTGKTTLAISHWNALVRVAGAGLIVDSAGANNFKSLPHARTVDEAWQLLYSDPPHHAIYTPRNLEDFINLIQGVGRAANEASAPRPVLVDEFWRWVYPWVHPDILDFTVAHRHRLPGVALLMTMTYLGHVRSDLVNLADHVYIFAQQSAAAIERIEREYRIPRESLPAFPPPGQYIHWP
jgi:hypothetical protein